MTEADIIKDLIKEVLAENKGTPDTSGADGPAVTGLELNVGGQAFKFANKEALEGALSQTFADFQKQKAEMDAKLAEAMAAAQSNTVTGKEEADKDSFDKEAFIKTFAEDPRKGLTELLNQVVFQGKGPANADAPSALRQNLNETEQIRKGLAVNQFLALHPEFNSAQAGAVVNQIREQSGFNFDVPGLEAAYGIAITRGLVAPPPTPAQIAAAQAAQQQQYPQQNSVAYQPYSLQNPQYQPQNPQYGAMDFNGGQGFAPPNVGRGPSGPGVPDWASQAENMSPDQIAAVIARMQGGV